MKLPGGAPIPREHGAWAMLLVPYVVALGAAGWPDLPGLLFLMTALAFFVARQPLFLLVRSVRRREDAQTRQSMLGWFTAYAAVGTVGGLGLLVVYGRWGLIVIGVLALLGFLVHLILVTNRQDRSVPGELAIIAALSLSAPGAYYSVTGNADLTAVALWVLNFLYSGSSVFYVKLRVGQIMRTGPLATPEARRRLSRDTVLYHIALFIAAVGLTWVRVVPVLAPVAFVPLLTKVGLALAGKRPEVNLRQVGHAEVRQAVLFAVLMIAAYWYA